MLTAFIIHSCKKDTSNNKLLPDVLDANLVNMAKQWYKTTYASIKSTGKLATESIGSGPNAWNQTFTYATPGSNSYTPMVLDSTDQIAIKSCPQ